MCFTSIVFYGISLWKFVYRLWGISQILLSAKVTFMCGSVTETVEITWPQQYSVHIPKLSTRRETVRPEWRGEANDCFREWLDLKTSVLVFGRFRASLDSRVETGDFGENGIDMWYKQHLSYHVDMWWTSILNWQGRCDYTKNYGRLGPDALPKL